MHHRQDAAELQRLKREAAASASHKPKPYGVVRMDHRLAVATQRMLNLYTANALPGAALLAVDGKFTNGTPAIDSTSTGGRLEAFLDHMLGGQVKDAAFMSAPGQNVNLGLVAKMQTAMGWTNAANMGLDVQQIRAIEGMSTAQMEAAHDYLGAGDASKPGVGAPMAAGLMRDRTLRAALEKIHDRLGVGQTAADALDNIYNGKIVDGVYGVNTEKNWKQFVAGKGADFANNSAAPVAPDMPVRSSDLGLLPGTQTIQQAMQADRINQVSPTAALGGMKPVAVAVSDAMRAAQTGSAHKTVQVASAQDDKVFPSAYDAQNPAPAAYQPTPPAYGAAPQAPVPLAPLPAAASQPAAVASAKPVAKRGKVLQVADNGMIKTGPGAHLPRPGGM